MKQIFALDIGTRNVVGLIAIIDEESNLEVLDAVSYEHETRAMEDGQIHDISKVIKTVEKVKKSLESRNNLELKEVAVAVAGRSLLTEKGKASKELVLGQEITEQDMLEADLLAIQESLSKIENSNEDYHFVGYTVSEYILDGSVIKNPKHQKGKQLKVEILATFLPEIVVDSMFTVTDKLNLKVINLTLEPIAAISVVIPEDMRKLNLALVDIGAGTSDIAITDEGKVIGYGMVPMAGDELSEKIATDFLLDFNEAENVKKQLSNKENKVFYTDILGMEYELEKEEIEKSIEERLKELSSKIAEKIVDINNKAPQAVIMIGGGSLIKSFRENISKALDIPNPRVAVRGTEVIKKFTDRSGILTSAEFVTPVGIAKMASKGRGFRIFNLKINDQFHRIFSFKESIKLIDAFLSAGIKLKDLYSKPGKALAFKLNGKLQIVKGEAGKLATIKVNEKEIDLEEEINFDSEIEIIKKRDGRDAVLRLEDFMKKYEKLIIFINEEKKEYICKIKINNEEKENSYLIKDSDEIRIEKKHSLRSILEKDIDLEKDIKIYLNSKEIKLRVPNVKIYRDKEELFFNDELNQNDKIILEKIDNYPLKIKDIVESAERKEFYVLVNEKRMVLAKQDLKILKNGMNAKLDDLLLNNDKIDLISLEDEQYIISDVFRVYKAEELLNKKGGILQIELNGRDAEFTSKIKSGDRIKMYYK